MLSHSTAAAEQEQSGGGAEREKALPSRPDLAPLSRITHAARWEQNFSSRRQECASAPRRRGELVDLRDNPRQPEGRMAMQDVPPGMDRFRSCRVKAESGRTSR